MKKNIIIDILALLCIILFVLCIHFYRDAQSTDAVETSNAFLRGYDNAIETAKLIDVTDEGYYIQFGDLIPSVHYYTFD